MRGHLCAHGGGDVALIDLTSPWSYGHLVVVGSIQFEELASNGQQGGLSTGKRTLVLRLMPADPSGVVNMQTVVLSRDGRAYACNYRRILSELLVVEGLK
jgi:hypothetical protein